MYGKSSFAQKEKCRSKQFNMSQLPIASTSSKTGTRLCRQGTQFAIHPDAQTQIVFQAFDQGVMGLGQQLLVHLCGLPRNVGHAIHHDGHQVIDHTKVQEEQGEANPQNLPAFSGQSVSIKSAQRGASRSAKMRDMIEVMEKSTQQVYLPLSAYL